MNKKRRKRVKEEGEGRNKKRNKKAIKREERIGKIPREVECVAR